MRSIRFVRVLAGPLPSSLGLRGDGLDRLRRHRRSTSAAGPSRGSSTPRSGVTTASSASYAYTSYLIVPAGGDPRVFNALLRTWQSWDPSADQTRAPRPDAHHAREHRLHRQRDRPGGLRRGRREVGRLHPRAERVGVRRVCAFPRWSRRRPWAQPCSRRGLGLGSAPRVEIGRRVATLTTAAARVEVERRPFRLRGRPHVTGRAALATVAGDRRSGRDAVRARSSTPSGPSRRWPTRSSPIRPGPRPSPPGSATRPVRCAR